jgi:hypothetical protein
MAIIRFEILVMLFSIILVGCSSSNNPSGQDCVDDNTCNYDSTCDSDVCIAIINVNQNNSIDISMINTVAIAGFQFEITGVNITGVICLTAIDNSLTVTTGNNIVLGFSFSLPTGMVASEKLNPRTILLPVVTVKLLSIAVKQITPVIFTPVISN